MDFALQASVEIPLHAQWTDTSANVPHQPFGQLNLFAYFRDRCKGKTFAL